MTRVDNDTKSTELFLAHMPLTKYVFKKNYHIHAVSSVARQRTININEQKFVH